MRRRSLALLALPLAGCLFATHPLALGPAAYAGPFMCDTDCKPAWERAQLWIVRHSKWKIQTATDVMIQTFSPVGYDVSYGFVATKEPIGGGRYRISLAMRCGNISCDPGESDVRSAFNYYVAGGSDVLAANNHAGSVR